MENASKALLFAGAILLGIMIVSLLILTLNKVSDYQASSTELANANEKAEFNEQFTQYVRDDVKGVELISLLNKVVDYNVKGIDKTIGELDYTKKITVRVQNMTAFNEKHAASHLFKNSDYEVKESNATTGLMKIINDQRKTENDYGRKELSILASNEESLKKYYTPEKYITPTNSDKEIIKQSGKSMEKILGKKITGVLKNLENSLKDGNGFEIIDTQSEFANFKTSKFECTGEEYWTEEGRGKGQVKMLTFKFIS